MPALNKETAVVIALLFLCLVLAEAAWSKATKKNAYNWKETLSNLAMMIGMRTSRLLFAGYVLVSLTAIHTLSAWQVPQDLGGNLLALAVIDFVYYWEHRMNHNLRFFWAFHEVHHSSPWLNFTTSFRLNWLAPITTPLFFAPVVLLGFSVNQVLMFFGLNLIYQFFLHTESIGKLGFLEGILNTPSSHRVHHGRNEIYFQKNFGGIFVLWDRLFHTYQSETEPVVYGISEGFVGHNPFVAEFRGFWRLAQVLFKVTNHKPITSAQAES
jgi:sterol desaturase/sphingolipid hydroxylase (fatty acid hydroxylase superfamily)